MFLGAEIPVGFLFGGDPMATTSKANASAKTYGARISSVEVCTGVFAPPVSEAEAQSRATTEAIVQDLMAKGIPKEKMRIPGKVKSHIVYMADDFDGLCK